MSGAAFELSTMKSQIILKHITHTRAQTDNKLKLVFTKIMFFYLSLVRFHLWLARKKKKKKKMVHPVTQIKESMRIYPSYTISS